ncbi:hypothetical protein MKZ38_008874 [Zalerion maritima]|uniref:Uncharacterized protein n=1 Tax=Zalerion maritima TaxID=339359 RepID=A0AAD5RV06_9PEZI|nr:hypothetical protein MKZ38_008874 [Zalerion maritima]
MPPLSGFSDNPLRTREDVVTATVALLKPLLPYFSPEKARIKLPVGTGAHFDDGAAQLEGFARPLWAVAALLAGAPDNPEILALADPWIKGLAIGTDPEHEEYWGDIMDMDQRMVEAEIIAYALLQAPEHFWDPLNERCKRNVERWLGGMNGKDMPTTNWLWFRATANLALVKVCGVPVGDLMGCIASDLDRMESFVREEGWSADGMWLRQEELEQDEANFDTTGVMKPNSRGRQCDYYSGSFAIQFSQLLYSRFAADIDLARAEVYRRRAREYGVQFWKYFDADGACIPFGRSLTYRFACSAFFAALGGANVTMEAPIDQPGAVRGFLLRNLRWWAKNSQDAFHQDGTLNIGWKYPQMYLSEDYNSPQSVYWCMKSLIVLAMTSNESFWNDPEPDYPTASIASVIKAPRQAVSKQPGSNHHFMLSAGQWVGWPMKATQAKYCKFAYSSAFGFSVPTGPLLEQAAIDNTLAFSRDGRQTWTTKWKCDEVEFYTETDGDCSVEAMSVTWYPWADRSVRVRTMLIPPMKKPCWHRRVHTIYIDKETEFPLAIAEGGFAVPKAKTDGGRDLQAKDSDQSVDLGSEGHYKVGKNGSLTISSAGASGISALWTTTDGSNLDPTVGPVKSDSNTNLMHQRTVIPTIQLQLSRSTLSKGSKFILDTRVFAVRNGGVWKGDLMDMW